MAFHLESVHVRAEVQIAYFYRFWPIFPSFDFRSLSNIIIIGTPFSLSLEINHALQDENFLNCPYEELPASFNSAGYFDEDEFLYFRERLLADTSVGKRSVRVSLLFCVFSGNGLFCVISGNELARVDTSFW